LVWFQDPAHIPIRLLHPNQVKAIALVEAAAAMKVVQARMVLNILEIQIPAMGNRSTLLRLD
jgi:hypothetical protein